MEPTKDENALVDVLDVLLRDGVVIRADVVVSVADVPLIGIKLSAAIAGMETMTEYGFFEEWDVKRRNAAIARRQYTESGSPRRIRGSRVAIEDGRGSRRSHNSE
ncbi:gas vesicle protein [Halobacteria archaeon AArc-curdl1]|uniref:Gas vesicle protein n=1 Tax=Natronosalvus hydrolyticus TaxID=2979988 RepID=A0AAP2ZAV1_9EURY|nr:gas vesicle protein [Halobacteria archaeon AArc-curdl1]